MQRCYKKCENRWLENGKHLSKPVYISLGSIKTVFCAKMVSITDTSTVLSWYLITPRVSGGCNSFDILCVCVSVCLSVSVRLTILAEWTDIQTWILVSRSNLSISRLSLNVKVIGQGSRSCHHFRLYATCVISDTRDLEEATGTDESVRSSARTLGVEVINTEGSLDVTFVPFFV